MAHYSVQPRYQIFTKGYRFLSLAKSMDRNTGNNKNKKSSGKCSQKFIDHAKKSARDAFKTASKGPIQKIAEATGDSIGKNTIDKITKVSRILPENSSEAVTIQKENNGLDRKIPRERHISPGKTDKTLLMIYD